MDKVIILAAGEGTRMKSEKSKVLHEIVNKPLLAYIIEASKEAGIEEIITIVGKNEDQVREKFGDSVVYRKQEIGPDFPYGTGYAVMQAQDLLDDQDVVLILSGDVPLIRPETIAKILNYHKEKDLDACVLTARIDDPSGYGRIVKDSSGLFVKIVEDRDASEEEKKIDEINSGIYAFTAGPLKKALARLDTDNSQGELYLTDVFEILKGEEKRIDSFVLEDPDEIRGINSKVQLAEVENIMRRRINTWHMENGVILENPDSISIEKGVKIGRDTKIEANTKILGDTEIGKNSFVGFNSMIKDCKIGDNVLIYSSYLEKSSVDDYTDIGPFARLRPNSHLGKRVHIGNFVEVKNSNIGDGSKAGHLAYIGDADLGKDINVGCGAVFVNYDGKFKHRSIVEDGGFIGSNANIVAPVRVEKEGYIAAGSTITKDVKNGQLAIERAKQRFIDGYVERKKIRDSKR